MTTESYEAPNFQISNDGSASQPPTEILKFERADWTSFRTVEGLQQKAGVAASKLRRLVLKELTDNALDTGAQCPRRATAGRRLLRRGRRQRHRRRRRKRSPGCSASPGR